MSKIKRAKRLSQARAHFVTAQASLFTDQRSGPPVRLRARLVLWCLGSNSTSLRWHMSNNVAKWTFSSFYASRITSFLLSTLYPVAMRASSRAFPILCPLRLLHPGIFIAWGQIVGSCWSKSIFCDVILMIWGRVGSNSVDSWASTTQAHLVLLRELVFSCVTVSSNFLARFLVTILQGITTSIETSNFFLAFSMVRYLSVFERCRALVSPWPILASPSF